MQAEKFLSVLGADFYAGVPDSQLKALCDELIARYGTGDPKHHIIAANEGNALALAAGYHLATGRTGAVYLQNSGLGNLINPLVSLCHEKVYGIPALLVVGWRGEPGMHDEPQHLFQGEVTPRLLEDMEISSYILDKETKPDALAEKMKEFRSLWAKGKQTAILVRKGALSESGPVRYANEYPMRREDILRYILSFSGTDPVVSTTGKTSRELFELRETRGQGHENDFLTVGSMGHSSSIALGIALQKPEQRVWLIDGDGALLMHMGSLAVIGSIAPPNLVHILINNSAHESVGGQPTVAGNTDISAVAKACGYPSSVSISDFTGLDAVLNAVKGANTLSFIEIRSAIGSRWDLGRPTISPKENMRGFMAQLHK